MTKQSETMETIDKIERRVPTEHQDTHRFIARLRTLVEGMEGAGDALHKQVAYTLDLEQEVADLNAQLKEFSARVLEMEDENARLKERLETQERIIDSNSKQAVEQGKDAERYRRALLTERSYWANCYRQGRQEDYMWQRVQAIDAALAQTDTPRVWTQEMLDDAKREGKKLLDADIWDDEPVAQTEYIYSADTDGCLTQRWPLQTGEPTRTVPQQKDGPGRDTQAGGCAPERWTPSSAVAKQKQYLDLACKKGDTDATMVHSTDESGHGRTVDSVGGDSGSGGDDPVEVAEDELEGLLATIGCYTWSTEVVVQFDAIRRLFAEKDAALEGVKAQHLKAEDQVKRLKAWVEAQGDLGEEVAEDELEGLLEKMYLGCGGDVCVFGHLAYPIRTLFAKQARLLDSSKALLDAATREGVLAEALAEVESLREQLAEKDEHCRRVEAHRDAQANAAESEVAALKEELDHYKDCATRWGSQMHDHMDQIDALKERLKEATEVLQGWRDDEQPHKETAAFLRAIPDTEEE